MGYSIEDLKKAGSIAGDDALILQQGGITKQIARSVMDQAVIVTASGAQNTGVVRKEGTYVLQNNSAEIRLTINNAIGKSLAADGSYTDSAAAAAGWIIKVLNNSTRNHTVISGANSWAIAKGEIQEYYWTGSAWTFHTINMVKNNDEKTNANDCFTDIDGVSFYRLGSSAANVPETGKAVFIQSNTRWTNSTSAYVTQNAFVVDTSAGTTEWRNAQHVYTRNGNVLNGTKTFSTWQKVTTEADVNNALANQADYNIVQKTQGNIDYNTLIPEENLKTETYFVYGNLVKPNTNAPNDENTVNYIVHSMKAGAGSAIRGRQIAYQCEDLIKSYTRVMKTNGVWTSWEKLTTESDLNSLLWRNSIDTLENNADLNTSYTVNAIKIYRAGYSADRQHAPSGWSGGILLSGIIGGFGFQLAFNYNLSRMNYRTYYNGTWNDWVIA